MKTSRGRYLLAVAIVVVTLLVTGCASFGPTSGQQVVQPAPTVNPLFVTEGTSPNTVSGWVIPPPGSALTQSLALDPPPTQVATSQPGAQARELAIYDDTLNPDWSTEHTDGMTFSLADSTHVYSGTVAASVTPNVDYGRLFFTVRKDAKETYGIDRVFGVSLWINSGSESLNPSSLSVTVVGSNDYTYWVPDDQSVTIDDKHFFSESRLFFLGINRPVPPDTWVEAVVWLDKLPYDPVYKYITGIYIKNDKGFTRTFYIDQVHLLLVG